MRRKWFYWSDEEVVGPFTDDEMRKCIKVGYVRSDTLVRMGPEGAWIPARFIKGWMNDKDVQIWLEQHRSRINQRSNQSATHES